MGPFFVHVFHAFSHVPSSFPLSVRFWVLLEKETQTSPLHEIIFGVTYGWKGVKWKKWNSRNSLIFYDISFAIHLQSWRIEEAIRKCLLTKLLKLEWLIMRNHHHLLYKGIHCMLTITFRYLDNCQI